MLRRVAIAVVLVVAIALVPIMPTGWITGADSVGGADAITETPAGRSTRPSPVEQLVFPKLRGPRPFVVGDRVAMAHESTEFGIPRDAVGTVTAGWHGSCGDGSYGVAFDNFPPNKGYSGFCIAAWLLRADD
jgi:hypothetical protein